MEESNSSTRKLSFSEIVEVLENYREKLDMFDAIAISKKDYCDYISERCGVELGVELTEKINKTGNFSNFENSGLVVEMPDFTGNVYSFLGRLRQFIDFSSKEELLEFLNNRKKYLKKIKPNMEKFSWKMNEDKNRLSNLMKEEELQSFFDEAFRQLTKEQQASLIVYKSSLFSIMNELWTKYLKAENVNIEEVLELLNTDYEPQLIKKRLWEEEEEKRKRITTNKKIQSKINFQHLVTDRYAYYKKAKENADNDIFFEKYFCNIDMSSKESFIRGIITNMQVLENVDNFILPKPLNLYRGIYGSADLTKLSNSPMASCSTKFSIAERFSQNDDGSGWLCDDSHSVVRILVEKGTPVLPLMFSVKRQFKTLDAEQMNKVDWDKLASDEIKLSLEPCSQPEVVLNEYNCNIPKITKDTNVIKRTRLLFNHYPPSFEESVQKDVSKAVDKLDIYFRRSLPRDILYGYAEGYSTSFYEIKVKALNSETKPEDALNMP